MLGYADPCIRETQKICVTPWPTLGEIRMNQNVSENVRLCRQWYAAFDKQDLDALMALFTDNAVVTIGAGGSASAVDYCGTFAGKPAIREYYESRFANDDSPLGSIKPFCGLSADNHSEFASWVMFWGELGRAHYKGYFLHVWTVNATQGKLSALEMYLEPSGRLSLQKTRRPARQKVTR